MITRRNLIWSLLAAPAIVHAGNLMPVKAMAWPLDVIQNWDGAILQPSEQLTAYVRRLEAYQRPNLFSVRELDPWGGTK